MRWLALVACAACGTDPVVPDPPYIRDFLAQLAAAPRATSTDRAAARAFLMDRLAQKGLQPELFTYATGADVVATVPATTGATRQIIVGAHFDTVAGSPGANDNATGCAAVLEVAGVIAHTTPRTSAVTFVLFDEEEVGLYGSRAYAAMLQTAGADVLAVHTIDQLGWDADHDRGYEIELPTPALEQAYQAAAAAAGVHVTTTMTAGTDHQAFRDRGFAAVGLTEGYVEGDTSPYRHTAQDTPDTVDDEYTRIGADVVTRVILGEL